MFRDYEVLQGAGASGQAGYYIFFPNNERSFHKELSNPTSIGLRTSHAQQV